MLRLLRRHCYRLVRDMGIAEDGGHIRAPQDVELARIDQQYDHDRIERWHNGIHQLSAKQREWLAAVRRPRSGRPTSYQGDMGMSDWQILPRLRLGWSSVRNRQGDSIPADCTGGHVCSGNCQPVDVGA